MTINIIKIIKININIMIIINNIKENLKMIISSKILIIEIFKSKN